MIDSPKFLTYPEVISRLQLVLHLREYTRGTFNEVGPKLPRQVIWMTEQDNRRFWSGKRDIGHGGKPANTSEMYRRQGATEKLGSTGNNSRVWYLRSSSSHVRSFTCTVIYPSCRSRYCC